MVGLLVGILYMESEYPPSREWLLYIATSVDARRFETRTARAISANSPSISQLFTSDCSEGSRQVQLGRGRKRRRATVDDDDRRD